MGPPKVADKVSDDNVLLKTEHVSVTFQNVSDSEEKTTRTKTKGGSKNTKCSSAHCLIQNAMSTTVKPIRKEKAAKNYTKDPCNDSLKPVYQT